MTADDGQAEDRSDDLQPEEPVRLTPEQRTQLSKISQAWLAQPGLAGVQRRLLSRFDQPLVELSRRMTSSFGAGLAKSAAMAGLAQSSWQGRYGAINSDISKSVALTQGRLDSIGAELVKNAQLAGSTNKMMEAFAAQQKSLWDSMRPTLAKMHAAFYPPNLRDIEGLTYEKVEEVAMVDGIALYGVPRPAIAQALIDAGGVQKRREILGRRWKQISADCREVVDGLDDNLRDYARTASVALDALDAGHVEAAQTLAATLIDALLRERLERRAEFTPSRSGKRTTAAYDDLSARQFIAFAPIWQAYQTYPTDDGRPVPTTFSRHASAHTVSRRQFSRRNAVQGTMLACSLIYHLDEQIAARRRRDGAAASA